MRPISRRAALAGGLALGALGGGAFKQTLGAAHGPWTEISIGARVIEVDGKPANVYGLRQPNGVHGLAMDAGQAFRVRLANRVNVPALIHWHGLTPPNALDGVPHVTQAPLEPSQSFDYEFPVNRPGTHWMHSHLGLQEQQLMAAPLIVRDPMEAHLDEQEVVVMLHDFTFRDPEEVIAGLGAGMGHGGRSGDMTAGDRAMNHDMHAMQPMPGTAEMPGMGMTHGSMNAMNHGMGEHDLNDVQYDAYLANDRTLHDPEIIGVEQGGRVRLRIINAAASTNFLIDLGGLEGQLIAVDGMPVAPLRAHLFPLAIAQRADIRLSLPAGEGAYPIFAQREGDRARTGIVLKTAAAPLAKLAIDAPEAIGPLDPSLSLQPIAAEPLALRAADRRFTIALTGDMMRYAWGLADLVSGAPKISVAPGERVEIEMVNQSMMSHPMHLHGHHFQIVAVNGVRVAGAVRDTVLVPLNGRLTIAFDADNPGRWMFHCHNLYHMVRGMMTELVYV